MSRHTAKFNFTSVVIAEDVWIWCESNLCACRLGVNFISLIIFYNLFRMIGFDWHCQFAEAEGYRFCITTFADTACEFQLINMWKLIDKNGGAKLGGQYISQTSEYSILSAVKNARSKVQKCWMLIAGFSASRYRVLLSTVQLTSECSIQ